MTTDYADKKMARHDYYCLNGWPTVPCLFKSFHMYLGSDVIGTGWIKLDSEAC